MISYRPDAGLVFGLIGGILIVFGGVIWALMGSYSLFLVLGLTGLAFGVLVIVASVGMYVHPEQHLAWGVIALVFSIASIVGFGGFIIGMALGIVGGALGIAWRPPGFVPAMMPPGPYASAPAPYPSVPAPQIPAQPAPAYGAPPSPWRMCMGCGRWIPWAVNVCPLCGTSAPVAAWVPKAWGAAPAAAPAPRPQVPAPVAATPPIQAPPRQPPAPAPLKAPCATCEAEAEWIPSMRRWYCPAEQRYF